MTNNPLQPDFSEKTMIEDIKNRPIPQYFDILEGEFAPNTSGVVMNPSSDENGNPYQPEFSSKTMLVDKKGRPIPQYYNVQEGFFYPLTTDSSGGGGGVVPTGAVMTVNLKTPDASGNVNTDFHVIEPLRADAPPSDYPMGATEFYTAYDPADYTAYIAANPSMGMLEKGQICVRTFRDEGTGYQQIDNVKDGVFNAAYVRVKVDLSTWGELSATGGSTPGPQGDPGIDGTNGTNGKDGSKWFIGHGAPSSVDGVENDLYLDSSTGNIWEKKNSMWQDTQVNIKGPQGAKGADGTNGTNGKDGVNGKDGINGTNGTAGSKWFTGAENPNTLSLDAKVDDMYLQYGDGNIWYKTEGDWHYNNGNIRGNKWYIVTGNFPNNGLKTGDLALKPDGSVWRHEGNVWSDTGVNLKGAPGDSGEQNILIKSEAEVFGVQTLTSGKFFVSRTGNKLPEGVQQALVEVVMQETDTPNLIAKNYFCMAMTNAQGIIAPMPLYWGFEEIDTTNPTPVIVEPINGWIPIGGGSAIEIADNITTTVPGKALDATQGKIIADTLFAARDSYNEHIVKTASNTDLGHVKVDGTTITVGTDGTISAVHSGTVFTAEDEVKLDGIAENANNYELPKATDAVIGGVKVDGESITIDADGTIKSEKFYNIETAPNDNSIVNSNKIGTTIYMVTKHKNPVYFKSIMDLIIARGIIMDAKPDTIKVNLFMSPPDQVSLFVANFELFAGTTPIQEVTFANDTKTGTTGWSPAELKGGMRDYTVSLFEFEPTTTPLDVMQGTSVSYMDNATIVGKWKTLIGTDDFDRVIVENFKSPTQYRDDDVAARFIIQIISTYDGGLVREKYYRTSTDNANWSTVELFDSNIDLDVLKNRVDVISTALTNHVTKITSNLDYGHVKVDGTTIIADEGVISTANNFYMDNSISTDVLPKDLKKGVTFTQLRDNTDAIKSWFAIINTLFGWNINQTQFCLNIKSVRDEGGATQEVDIILTLNANGYKGEHIAKLSRTSLSNDKWNFSRGIMNINTGSGSPQPSQYGLLGSLWMDRVGGVLYQMRNPAATVPMDTGWVAMTDQIQPLSYLPTDPEDRALYSAYSINSILKTHAESKASENDEGHVKVDGTTITSTDGVISATQVPGPKGDTGVVVPGDNRQVKMWFGTAITSGGDGSWVIDYTAAGFTEVKTIQTTLESSITAAADKPLGTHVVSKSLTNASGKAYKATSAGLLTAMQQLAAENGVTVNVMVVGY